MYITAISGIPSLYDSGCPLYHPSAPSPSRRSVTVPVGCRTFADFRPTEITRRFPHHRQSYPLCSRKGNETQEIMAHIDAWYVSIFTYLFYETAFTVYIDISLACFDWNWITLHCRIDHYVNSQYSWWQVNVMIAIIERRQLKVDVYNSVPHVHVSRCIISRSFPSKEGMFINELSRVCAYIKL